MAGISPQRVLTAASTVHAMREKTKKATGKRPLLPPPHTQAHIPKTKTTYCQRLNVSCQISGQNCLNSKCMRYRFNMITPRIPTHHTIKTLACHCGNTCSTEKNSLWSTFVSIWLIEQNFKREESMRWLRETVFVDCKWAAISVAKPARAGPMPWH